MNRFRRIVGFTVVIPWRGGNPQREACLQHTLDCIDVQDREEEIELIDFEVLLVEHVDPFVKPTGFVPSCRRLTHHKLHDQRPFNKSWCMNVGTNLAGYQNLIFVDADMLFGKFYFRMIRDHVFGVFGPEVPPPKKNLVLCWNYHITMMGKDNPVCRYNRPDMLRMLGGVWYCDKEYYLKELGGMNEAFFGYGGEDNEAYERAAHIQGAVDVMPYPIVHQYHDWAAPAPAASGMFFRSRDNLKNVTEKLRSSPSGNKEAPSPIDMSKV